MEKIKNMNYISCMKNDIHANMKLNFKINMHLVNINTVRMYQGIYGLKSQEWNGYKV